MKDSIRLWWRATRPFSFTVSAFPPILGLVLAVIENPGMNVKWGYFLLTVAGCVLAHAGANLLSDYYDFKKRVDREGTYGSSGVLVEGLMSPEQIRTGAWTCLIIAAFLGTILIFGSSQRLMLAGLVALGGILAIFYTAGPIQLKYRALGDVAVFLAFGSAMVLGAYIIQAGRFSWAPVLYALPIGLLVDAILHGNNIRDIENDKVVHINTLPILIGEESAKKVYYLLIFGAYLCTVILIAVAGLPLITLLTFLSLPLAIKLMNLVKRKNETNGKQFLMIDAMTAQFHTAFSGIFIASLLIQYFFFT